MAARYLQNDIKRTDYFMDMLIGLQEDAHQYYTLKIPEEALLGRYHFELEDRVNGRVFSSKTADTDYFLVEKLNLIKIEAESTYSIAFIENPSPEPVLAQMCQFTLDLNKEYPSKIIQLEPKSITKVPFHETGILMYRDKDEILRLYSEKAPLTKLHFSTRL